MSQSPLTVTPENPTPPTNLSCVGASPPLDPAQAAVDDGWVSPGANYNVFAAKTAAAGAGTSVDAEGKGTEILVTQTYSASIYNPNGPLLTDSCGIPYTTQPNQSHASSLSPATNPTLASIAPTTSVHGTAPVTMTATGVGFNKQSAIVIGGVKQATTFVSSTSLTCQATPPAAAGAPAVTVVTGGVVTTAPQTWTIT
jgi:hypothetical protein